MPALNATSWAMNKLATQIYRRIADVPGQIWDAAAQGELGFDRGLLATIEAADGGKSRYIVHEGSCGSSIIATAMEFRDTSSGNPFTDLLLGRVNKRLPVLRRVMGPMLILRTRFANTCGIALRPDGNGEAVDRLDCFIDDLECFADSEGLGIVVLGVSNADKTLSLVLESRGYADSIGRPVARLHVNWSSWEGYLQAARRASANTASSIRREVNRARKRGLVISEWDSHSTSERSLRRIYDAHHLRMNDRALSYPEDFFTQLKERIGDGIRVLVAHRDSELIGSTFLLVSNDHAILPLVGIDHAREGGAFAYFNLTYYAPIKMAAEQGIKSITYGAGAYAAKIQRGCRAELSRVFWRPSGWAGRRICGCVAAAHESVYRKKFYRELAADEFSTLASS